MANATALKTSGGNHATTTTDIRDLLTAAQLRILNHLAEVGTPQTRTEISEGAHVPMTHVAGFTMKQYATKKTPALLEQGYVSSHEMTIDTVTKAANGNDVVQQRTTRAFKITAAGIKALAAVAKLDAADAEATEKAEADKLAAKEAKAEAKEAKEAEKEEAKEAKEAKKVAKAKAEAAKAKADADAAKKAAKAAKSGK